MIKGPFLPHIPVLFVFLTNPFWQGRGDVIFHLFFFQGLSMLNLFPHIYWSVNFFFHLKTLFHGPCIDCIIWFFVIWFLVLFIHSVYYSPVLECSADFSCSVVCVFRWIMVFWALTFTVPLHFFYTLPVCLTCFCVDAVIVFLFISRKFCLELVSLCVDCIFLVCFLVCMFYLLLPIWFSKICLFLFYV